METGGRGGLPCPDCGHAPGLPVRWRLWPEGVAERGSFEPLAQIPPSHCGRCGRTVAIHVVSPKGWSGSAPSIEKFTWAVIVADPFPFPSLPSPAPH